MDEPGEDAELDGLAKVNEELNEQSKGLRNLQADHEIGEHQMQAEEVYPPAYSCPAFSRLPDWPKVCCIT